MEAGICDVAGLVLTQHALGGALDLLFRKNEAMVGGFPGLLFVLIEFQQRGGVSEVAALAILALGLDLAQFVEGFLELARQARALHVEAGDEAVGVDYIKIDTGLLAGRIGCASEQVGFEQRDAIEAPGGVDQFLDELSFGRGGGPIILEELAAVGFVGGGVLGGQDDGLGGEAVADGVERGALFAGFGARACGVLGRSGPVYAAASCCRWLGCRQRRGKRRRAFGFRTGRGRPRGPGRGSEVLTFVLPRFGNSMGRGAGCGRGERNG